MATPTELAAEMVTTTVAVPHVLAVRVEVRVPAARTAAPYASLPRHLPSTAMCLCVQLQDSHVKPSKDDPKYMDQARNALLAMLASGQEITLAMLRKETQKQWRKAYNRWNKQHNRTKKRRSRTAMRLAELGFGRLSTLVRTLTLSCLILVLFRRSPRTCARGHAHARAPGARAHARLTRATRAHTRLRPCGADVGESSSSPPLACSSPQPALLSPQASASPAPKLSPLALSDLLFLAN